MYSLRAGRQAAIYSPWVSEVWGKKKLNEQFPSHFRTQKIQNIYGTMVGTMLGTRIGLGLATDKLSPRIRQPSIWNNGCNKQTFVTMAVIDVDRFIELVRERQKLKKEDPDAMVLIAGFLTEQI